MICNRCGATVEEGNFCPVCGNNMEEDMRQIINNRNADMQAAFGIEADAFLEKEVIPDYIPPDHKRRNRWILVTGILFLLVAAGVTGALFWYGIIG